MPRGKHGHHARGENHPRWNGGRSVNQDGYVKVQVGKGHPLADGNGYAYEHRIIAQAESVVPLTRNDIIHHENRTRDDNAPSNLSATTRDAHNRLHNATDRGRDPKTGRFVSLRGGPTPKSGGNLLDGRTWEEFPAGQEVMPCG
jgi:hypothetical protein